MTITIQPARNEYTANAGQTIFDYTFKIFEDTDLNVYVTPAGQESNDITDLITAYTVSGVGLAAGGSITLTVPTNVNDLVTIVSNVPSNRTVEYQNNGDFRPNTVNADFDRVVSIVKKIEDSSNRSLLTAQSQQGPKPLSLPLPVAGELLRWNAGLTGLENFNLVSGSLIASGELVIFPTVAALAADTSGVLVPGINTSTQGSLAGDDGSGQDYIVKSSIGSERADNLKNIELANGNFAVRDKPFFITKAPAGAVFAPNEFKYLFMDPLEYEAGNAAPANGLANQFHFYADAADVRCEFEATGRMQFYLEGGEDESVWYGLQWGAEHLWSFGVSGTPTPGDKDLKFTRSFGVTDGALTNFVIKHDSGQVQIGQVLAGTAQLKLFTEDALANAAGLLVEVGAADALYLASFRNDAGAEKLKINADGSLNTLNGSAALPAYSFLGDTDTGVFNPGANAVSIATAGVERFRINSVGRVLVGGFAGSTGGGGGIIELNNVTGSPTSPHSTGGSLYSVNGALTWYGSSGTVTTLAPA